MPKISIIMPSLNVVSYYAQCMDSALGQTLKDLEIIAVDAGSIDGTLDILGKYAELDKRIKVIHSGEKSYGAQMNIGIEIATGEYIAFLETDDYLCTYALERLYNIAKVDDLDYVKGWTYSFWEEKSGLRVVYDDDKFFLNLPIGEDVFSPQEYPKLLVSDFHVWNGIYKREFLKSIRFNETKGAAFQDIGFIIQYITKAKKARYVDLPIYWYRRSNEASSVFNEKGFKYLADEYEHIYEIGKNITEVQWPFVWYRLVLQTMTRFETMYKSGRTWLSMENELDRLRCLLIKAEDNEQLGEIYSDKYHKKLLELILSHEYEILKVSDWQDKITGWIFDCFSTDDVLVYGAGRRGRMIKDMVLKMDKQPPVAFIDSNPQMWGKIVAGTMVISLDEAKEKYYGAKYLIAVKDHEQEIKENLLASGIASPNIICFDEIAEMWWYHIGKSIKNATLKLDYL